ncbi:Uu.00g007270.m01.CDS01 [Anthostomella pinea]|uniref:Uu.00g007270.m01.CDS01 n=1 Tax=Anthostomella pinea TaxID=933095 RepID=A0AAI8VX05_9PEZI|nr:Uu.00g007270.m01.CDS01 [Anthostomella pinea]
MVLDTGFAAARYAVLILGSYYLLVIGHRILLHPLRRYPGPLVAKFTDWYGGFHALSMHLHLTTYQDHKKYGRVMKHGPNRLVFNSVQALQDIYSNERTTKSHIYLLTVQANGIDSIFNAVDRKRHASKRRLVGRAVTKRAMRMFGPIMHEQIDVFACKRLGLDIVGHLAFGFALDTQTDPTYRFIIDGIAMGNYRANSFMQLPFLKNGAGGDTTATALSALFFYPSHNPVAYRQVSEEVRGTFTHAAEIQGGPMLSDCRYLRAYIDATLRMSSPISGTLWRELAKDEEAKGPLIVDRHVIPRGTQVGVNIYTLHHNEDYFPEPFDFRSERWLVEDSSELQTMHAAFATFSAGARGCAGKPMAYLESSLVAAKTLWYFDFQTAPGDVTGVGIRGKMDGRGRREEYQLRDVFSAAHDGPYVVFRPRGDACKELGVRMSQSQ